jgi:regulator of ribonuclease activity A
MPAPFTTADLCDAAGDRCQSCGTPFRQFGARPAFAGRIRTVRCHADNALVRRMLETPCAGEVLVVDGGGFLGAALLGDQLAALGVKNGWAGVVIYGAVRDSVAVAQMNFGVKALGTNPRRGGKHGTGETDVVVEFGGVKFTPGHWLYSDDDGILVAEQPLVPAD